MREDMSRSDLPPMWRPADRYIGICARCGSEGLKAKMVSLYVKKGAYSNLKILCHVCQDCYIAMLDDMGVSEG